MLQEHDREELEEDLVRDRTTDLAVTERDRPDFSAAIAEADHLAESTRDAYARAIERAQEAGVDLFDPRALETHARTLSQSGRAFLSAGLRVVTDRLAAEAKANATPHNVAAVQATLYRVEAINAAVTTQQAEGQKVHTWLTRAEVMQLLDTCDPSTVKGKRDRVGIGLLVAAGLRRSEAVALTFGDVKLQPAGDRIRTVLEVEGKGAKTRAVPISDGLAAAIEEWGAELDAGRDDRILRRVRRGGHPGEKLSTQGLFNVVRSAGEAIGKPDLAPHDLRRTFAQLGYEAGVPLTQVSRLLGHASIETTKKYLNLELDLESTVSDFVPFG